MLLNQIIKSFKIKEERGWEKVFFSYDLHETIILPDYDNVSPLKFYPFAKEALQLITKRNDIVNFIFTCSHPHEMNRYLKFFKEHDVDFKYVNENPEVKDTRLGCYSVKPYFNCYFEDKCGFDAETEWEPIYNYFKKLN